ncbi:hypothetical protein A2U01_0095999, partial [Trifolium medium]|nr:hypothetical protein [Trifolium medium]
LPRKEYIMEVGTVMRKQKKKKATCRPQWVLAQPCQESHGRAREIRSKKVENFLILRYPWTDHGLCKVGHGRDS